MTREDSPLRDAMVFVVGARRSGTNWLQHLLCLHPSVVAVPSETYLFYDAVPGLEARVQHGLVSSAKTGLTYMPRDVFLDAVRDYCDTLFGTLRDLLAPAATHVVERTPWHARRLRLIGDVYPDAYVLHIVRDPRDVAASLVAQEWGPASYAEAAQEWVDTVGDARACAGPRYREVRHEDLQANPLQQMAELFAWLGLSVDAKLGGVLAREAAVPVNTTRADAGRVDGSRRASLDPRDVAEVERVAAALMREVGYGPSPTAAPRTPPVSLGRRARVVAARARGRAARADAAPRPGTVLWGEQAQHTVDAFLSAVALDDAAALARMVAPDAEVVVNDARHVGQVGVDALVAAMPRHRQLRQVSGVAEPGAASVTAVVVWAATEPPQEWTETYVVTPEGSIIRRLAYAVTTSPSSPPDA